MIANGLSSLLWFIAILAMIPIALWLLKRTPIGGAGVPGVMRNVATLPLSANQRIVTVEVGQGEERRWLVLGVTAQSITTLHTLSPLSNVPPAGATLTPPFAQLLARLRRQDPAAPGTQP